MANIQNIDNFFNIKQKKIQNLTNNKINNLNQVIDIIYDEQYFSKNMAIFDSGKKILIGKYEILGYSNNNKWSWAFNNLYIEKYLTNISKNVYNNLKKHNLDLDIDTINIDLLKYCLYYSDSIWIVKKNINFEENLYEYIIITEINQIT